MKVIEEPDSFKIKCPECGTVFEFSALEERKTSPFPDTRMIFCPRCKDFIYTRGYNFDYREKVPKTTWKGGNYVCVKKH